MAVRSRLRAAFRRRNTDETEAPVAVTSEQQNKVDPSPEVGPAVDLAAPEDVVPAEDAQRGVQDVEAVTLSWSKRSLIMVFVK